MIYFSIENLVDQFYRTHRPGAWQGPKVHGGPTDSTGTRAHRSSCQKEFPGAKTCHERTKRRRAALGISPQGRMEVGCSRLGHQRKELRWWGNRHTKELNWGWNELWRRVVEAVTPFIGLGKERNGQEVKGSDDHRGGPLLMVSVR
jgi:hypothetical protein